MRGRRVQGDHDDHDDHHDFEDDHHVDLVHDSTNYCSIGGDIMVTKTRNMFAIFAVGIYCYLARGSG